MPRRDVTAAFFEDLASQEHIPLLHRTRGTVRIDLDEGGSILHWYVSIENGDVKVTHRNVRADAVMHTSKQLFDRMARGTVNATAAMLRGVLTLDGDLGLIATLARLLPGPPKSKATFLERQKALAG